ncbi:MAG: SgcJ/EcaC family oxidoreductase [Gemmatimonadetes bacterium]|nr:nuclear transport factor 2 family protein [Gemmatimonadota bacterium]NNM07298.1 SgcJ/EcaC family oxidoreductase [Gemmatimonadota bacterium]
MRAIWFPMTLFVALHGACTPPSPQALTETQRESLQTEVRAVVSELTAAMNSHDPDRLFSLYRESEDFVYMGCTDPLFGFESFSARVGPYYRANPDVVFQQEILQLQILSATSAVVTLQGASTEADALFWTEVLVREDDGRWLIAHEHESWPGCPGPKPLHPTGTFDPSGGGL